MNMIKKFFKPTKFKIVSTLILTSFISTLILGHWGFKNTIGPEFWLNFLTTSYNLSLLAFGGLFYEIIRLFVGKFVANPVGVILTTFVWNYIISEPLEQFKNSLDKETLLKFKEILAIFSMIAISLIANTLISYFEQSPNHSIFHLYPYASYFSFYGILLLTVFISYIFRQNPDFFKNFLIFGIILSMINLENFVLVIVFYPLISLPLLGFMISMAYFKKTFNETTTIKISLLLSIALFIELFYSLFEAIFSFWMTFIYPILTIVFSVYAYKIIKNKDNVLGEKQISRMKVILIALLIFILIFYPKNCGYYYGIRLPNLPPPKTCNCLGLKYYASGCEKGPFGIPDCPAGGLGYQVGKCVGINLGTTTNS